MKRVRLYIKRCSFFSFSYVRDLNAEREVFFFFKEREFFFLKIIFFLFSVRFSLRLFSLKFSVHLSSKSIWKCLWTGILSPLWLKSNKSQTDTVIVFKRLIQFQSIFRYFRNCSYNIPLFLVTSSGAKKNIRRDC